MIFPLQQCVFFIFAALLIAAALMTVLLRNPVRCALFLVLAFFAAAALWILLEAEFLGLILILVYVGAVMTLFLFVIMTLNIELAEKKSGFVLYLPYVVFSILLLLSLLIYTVFPISSAAGLIPASLELAQIRAHEEHVRMAFHAFIPKRE